MNRLILILLAAALFAGVVASGTCSGPIDTIFTGWRDTTGCTVTAGWNCFGTNSLSNDYNRDAGAMVLMFLVWLSVLSHGLFKVARWLWRKTA
jgi:hypothetical protein